MIPPIRSASPHVAEGTVYLDHAATGPLTRPSLDALAAYFDERGRTNPNNFETVLPRLEAGRGVLAELIGAKAEDVDYVPNTSYGLNILARGLDWREGDRVAVPDCEFPANLLPWKSLERRGVAVDLIPSREGTFTVDDVRAALTPRTRVLAVSWVQFLSGFRAPLADLAEICRQRGVILAVDAIQGVGALKLDAQALGLDFVACGGHKWMLGAQGSAFVMVGERLRAQLEPTRGWLNGPVNWEDFGATTLDLHPDATRFRVGTMPTGPILALIASAEQFLSVGPEAVEASVLAASARLAEGLNERGLARWGPRGAPRSGIVTFEHAQPEALHAHLASRGIVCSLRDRKLRLAPHASTSDDDIARTLAAVREFAERPVTA